MFYSDKPLDEMLKHMEKLFLTNTIAIRPERKSKPRLDKDKHKSTIATNSINYLKRKKKMLVINQMEFVIMRLLGLT